MSLMDGLNDTNKQEAPAHTSRKVLTPTLPAKPTLQVKKPLLTIQPKQPEQATQLTGNKPFVAVKAVSKLSIQAKPQQAAKPLLPLQVSAKDKPAVQAASLGSMDTPVQATSALAAEITRKMPLAEAEPESLQHTVKDMPSYEEGREAGHAESEEAAHAAQDFEQPTQELAHDRKQRLATQTKVEELTALMKAMEPVIHGQAQAIINFTEQLKIQASNLQSVTEELEALKKEEPLD